MVKPLKKTSREAPQQEASRLLSAAEFLLSIPLGTKPASSPAGARSAVRHASPRTDLHPTGDDHGSDAATTQTRSATGGLLSAMGSTTDVNVSVRLRGDRFRHITSRGARSSPAFREAVEREGVKDGRVLFSANRSYPSAMLSIVKYDPVGEAGKVKERQAAATRLLLDPGTGDSEGALPPYLRWRIGRSYHGLLRPLANMGGQGTGAGKSGRRHAPSYDDATDPGYVRRYDPLSLDDPSFDREGGRLGYERDGYVAAILTFRTTAAAKDDANTRFAQAFPWLDFGEGQSLTLSQIRSLKARALGLWYSRGWEVSTVALAVVAFERLVWKRLVTKTNRKLAMAACLLLAFKHNEASGEVDGRVPPVRTVVSALETTFTVSRRDLIKAEFPVFVHLGFALHAPEAHVLPHVNRLLTSKGVTLPEYMVTGE